MEALHPHSYFQCRRKSWHCLMAMPTLSRLSIVCIRFLHSLPPSNYVTYVTFSLLCSLFPLLFSCVDPSTNPTCYFVLVVEKVGTTSYANWIDYSITSYPDGTAPLTTSTATMTTVTTKTTKTTVTTVANVTAAPSRVATTLPSKLPMETCSTKPVLCVGASFCAAVNVVSAESCSAHCATTYKSYDLDFYYEASINSNIQTCLCRKHIPAGCDVVAVCCDVDDSASVSFTQRHFF